MCLWWHGALDANSMRQSIAASCKHNENRNVNLRVSSISCNPLPWWSPLKILSARGETCRMRPKSSSKLGNSISTPSVLEGICLRRWCVSWKTGLEKPFTAVAAARRMVATNIVLYEARSIFVSEVSRLCWRVLLLKSKRREVCCRSVSDGAISSGELRLYCSDWLLVGDASNNLSGGRKIPKEKVSRAAAPLSLRFKLESNPELKILSTRKEPISPFHQTTTQNHPISQSKLFFGRARVDPSAKSIKRQLGPIPHVTKEDQTVF